MNPLQGRPVIWPDLFAEDRELYGSEKEEKFPSTFPLYQIEDWDGHYSRRILFLYKYTRYPRYERTSFFPFYDRIQSRLDGRRRSWSLLHYWREEKGYQYLAWWPVLPFVRYREQKGELSRNGWFPFYSYSRHAADHSILSVPTLPFLYYRRIEKQKRSHNVLGFINVTCKDNRISSYYVAPFVFHKGGEGGHTITPFYYHSRPRPGDHSLLIPILPLVYYSTKDSNVLYRDPASGLHTVREETSGTFFHRRRRITRLAGATDEAPGPSGILAEEFMAGLFWLFPLYSREIRPGYSYINYFLWLATREDSPQKFSSYSPFHRTYRAKIKSDQLRSIDQFSLFYIPVMRKKVTQEYASTLSPFHYRYRLLDPERRRDKEAPIKKFRASVFYLPIYQRTTYSDREEAVAAFGLYKNTTADNPSRNDHFRILTFYYKNVKDGRGRSWIAPFWFSGWEGSRRWFFFFPFYYSHKEQGDLAKGEAVTTRVVSLWKREVKIRPGPGGPVTSRSVSIPTGIPFLYAHESTTGERSYTRWFNVVKEEDRLAETSSFRVWPFYSPAGIQTEIQME
ncbi:MAG: hypothetical protein HS115_09065 [Spirochaetales bacterium]|nr:hypothetical protein [Spirochaetales bacterium]